MFDYIDFHEKKKNGYHSNVIPCTIHPQNIQCVAKIDKHNEHAIYHFMQSIPLGVIAPKYFGLWECHDYAGFPKKEKDKRMLADGNFNYIIMEDLMRGFKSPNFVDIKIGTRASDVKTKKRSIDRLAFLVATTTSADFGFRITDIMNNKNKKDGSKKNKRREMAANIFETSNFFKTFFSTHQLKSIYDELKHIRDVIILTLHQFPGFRIYASSVFITYDNDAPENSEVRVKLIDFAHVHFDVDKDDGSRNDLQYDDGVLRGLDSLVLLVGLILCERKVPLGNENLVDPEEELEKEKKKLKKEQKDSKKEKKDKNKQDKDTKKSKNKDKDTKKSKDKSKDSKSEKSKEKDDNDNKTPKEGSENKAKDELQSNLEKNESEEKTEIDNQKDQLTTNSENTKTKITQKKDEEKTENIKSGTNKEAAENSQLEKDKDENSTTQDEEMNEEEEEEAEDINEEPLDSESFNDRQPESESEDKHEEND